MYSARMKSIAVITEVMKFLDASTAEKSLERAPLIKSEFDIGLTFPEIQLIRLSAILDPDEPWRGESDAALPRPSDNYPIREHAGTPRR